ncbi:hypothetical protein IU500_32355 [Nocardia terpenica]|uniref:Uncharacterized protein n=1 Tax=Nocardia terpenica TaxID=455432 RepID=A0A164M2V7_9NOCA|nr:hypothetical protein [Nocardia terpenica]KZM72980.1 hypothetical protein AWN90_30020 [Nocardia terpenica]MBF6061077.1 hypothetical protein [Nocardia terpenica]MBF6108711.1 hypothetical protein [Nocardia terpenica]MBF6114103.1 hypothetical protein [Nocardia terpenica]MBF6120273.1 hypothetical protein [Nocardia terpenica]
MALIEIEDLPASTADVLGRRARAAGMPVVAYIRRELTALAGRRVPIDTVVEFLDAERPDQPGPEIDSDAMVLLNTYDLPADAWGMLARRAAATGLPLSDYVRQELITLARRSTIDDLVQEFREAKQQDPSLDIDLDAIVSAIRSVRGQ